MLVAFADRFGWTVKDVLNMTVKQMNTVCDGLKRQGKKGESDALLDGLKQQLGMNRNMRKVI